MCQNTVQLNRRKAVARKRKKKGGGKRNIAGQFQKFFFTVWGKEKKAY